MRRPSIVIGLAPALLGSALVLSSCADGELSQLGTPVQAEITAPAASSHLMQCSQLEMRGQLFDFARESYPNPNAIAASVLLDGEVVATPKAAEDGTLSAQIFLGKLDTSVTHSLQLSASGPDVDPAARPDELTFYVDPNSPPQGEFVSPGPGVVMQAGVALEVRVRAWDRESAPADLKVGLTLNGESLGLADVILHSSGSGHPGEGSVFVTFDEGRNQELALVVSDGCSSTRQVLHLDIAPDTSSHSRPGMALSAYNRP